MTNIALLRGINVGGNHMIGMAALRELLESIGLKNVRTLLQSGNVVFEGGGKKVGGEIEDVIENAFGFRPSVILRSAEQMEDVVARNPFAHRSDVPGNKLLVTFLECDPKTTEIVAAPEEVHVLGREMYIYFPVGVGQSKFPHSAVAKQLGVTGTARNWNTVLKLVTMARQSGSSRER